MTFQAKSIEDTRLNMLSRAVHALNWAGGAAMLLMVAIIVVSVAMRYILGQPVLGSNELIQSTSVALVMTALPYCTEQEGHIRVDIFDLFLGKWGCLAGDLLFRGLSSFVLGILTYRAVLKAVDTFRWSDAANMLNLPLWPLYSLVALGSGLCVLVFLAQIAAIAAGVRKP